MLLRISGSRANSFLAQNYNALPDFEEVGGPSECVVDVPDRAVHEFMEILESHGYDVEPESNSLSAHLPMLERNKATARMKQSGAKIKHFGAKVSHMKPKARKIRKKVIYEDDELEELFDEYADD